MMQSVLIGELSSLCRAFSQLLSLPNFISILMCQKYMLSQRLFVLQLLVAQRTMNELRRMCVLNVNSDFVLNNCFTHFALPLIFVESFAVLLQVLNEL